MDYQTLNFDVDSGVATITLNRPEALNAMSPAMAKELHEVALQIDANNSVRAVILTGTGKAFCAGGDLGAFVAAGEQARTLILQMTGDLHLALSRLSRNRAPVIAAVNGTAAGAGFSLAMAADLAIAEEQAVFTMAYTNAGLSPDGSSTYFMPRKIGDRRTRELMLTNRLLTAPEALDWGVVNQVVEGGGALAAARVMATGMAQGPTEAYAQVKRLLDSSFSQSLETQMELEARAIADQVASVDGQEGMLAFVEKRKPQFRGV
ncbi:MAG TPA: enoyl-CoA hydratase [Gammaproteobacteria bacterium]|nr:enoyl-CoA hydratase [Gammaproteobacteria bacterium]|tara:strand:- start:1899 stop:2687 length:789 start_codon:yes stop_codon:yes gene_type:complete